MAKPVTSLAALAMAALAACVLGGLAVGGMPDLLLAMLGAVFAAAIAFGHRPALLSALGGAVLATLFFHPPHFGLAPPRALDLVNLAIFLVGSAAALELARQTRASAERAERRASDLSSLYEFALAAAAAVDREGVARTVVEHLHRRLGTSIVLFIPAGDRLGIAAERLGARAPDPSLAAAAREVARGDRPASAHPGWRLFGLRSARGLAGVLAVEGDEAAGDGEGETAPALAAMLNHATLVLEWSRLRESLEELRIERRNERFRESLLNAVSHELRTPVAVVLGAASELDSFAVLHDARSRAELVRSIRVGAERLSVFIDNVLALSQLQAGALQPRRELVELADIVSSALRRQEDLLADHAVSVDLPADLPMARLDLFLTEHVFLNLLGNAARHTPAGTSIGISARAENGRLLVEVADDGPGVGADEFDRLAEPFARGGSAQASGTGLGLAISRGFVEIQGGRMTLENRNGLLVRVELPLDGADGEGRREDADGEPARP